VSCVANWLVFREYLAYIAAGAFGKSAAFDAAINGPSQQDFRPPSELLKTDKTTDATYEIWHGNSASPAMQQLLRRLQILVPFFVEGGTPIDDSDWDSGRWTIFLLYKKADVSDPSISPVSPYTFMGYCTVYDFYPLVPTLPLPAPGTKRKAIHRTADVDFTLPYPDKSLSDLPVRSRISQFIILPPFQGSGHGARFYSSIFQYYVANPQTVEITVEDPNEAFDDLRDLNDLIYLRSLPEFQALHIDTDAQVRKKGRVPSNDIIDQAKLEVVRKKSKIAPRQFQRLVEMQLLSHIPSHIRKSLLTEHIPKKTATPETKRREHEYRLWCLLVKQRLYKHNKDTLIQLDYNDRIEKLEETAGGVELGYGRLLRKLDEAGAADKDKGKGLEAPSGNGEKVLTPGKRAAEDEEELPERSTKKAKVTEE